MIKEFSDVTTSDKSDVNADKYAEHNFIVQVLVLSGRLMGISLYQSNSSSEVYIVNLPLINLTCFTLLML